MPKARDLVKGDLVFTKGDIKAWAVGRYGRVVRQQEGSWVVRLDGDAVDSLFDRNQLRYMGKPFDTAFSNAQQAFMDAEGKSLSEPYDFTRLGQSQYLRNRIIRAYAAGYRDGEKQREAK